MVVPNKTSGGKGSFATRKLKPRAKVERIPGLEWRRLGKNSWMAIRVRNAPLSGTTSDSLSVWLIVINVLRVDILPGLDARMLRGVSTNPLSTKGD